MSGPPAASLAAMYQETLLAHYRAPQNRRVLADATARGAHRNPLCGDDLEVAVRCDGDLLTEVAFQGRGCSLATASASLLTEAVRGLTVRDARALADAVDAMLEGDASVSLPAALDPLRSVAPFPARHGCVRMAWQALRGALG
ncbi:MAG: SUF system NifU family Fe-S cluster assembly protein [Gemmatimonadetes bacterium]|nr:SUF system NifU family Fe-S cluster assembly protein [Gemmatimonadota bacterium]